MRFIKYRFFFDRMHSIIWILSCLSTGLQAVAQEPITVRYEGEDVGEFIADIVVENTVILELKSVT